MNPMKRRINMDPSLSSFKKRCKKELKETKIKEECKHIWEEDEIDIMSGWAEKSQSICYCILCFQTKK